MDFSDIRKLLQADIRHRLEEQEVLQWALWLQACFYRERGFTYRAVAEEMEVSLRTARRWVLKGEEVKRRWWEQQKRIKTSQSS